MSWVLKDQQNISGNQVEGKALQEGGRAQAKACRGGSSWTYFDFLRAIDPSVDSCASRPVMCRAAGSLSAAADIDFLTVQGAVGLMEQFWKPQDICGQWSTKKGIVDSITSSIGRDELNMG